MNLKKKKLYFLSSRRNDQITIYNFKEDAESSIFFLDRFIFSPAPYIFFLGQVEI